MVNRSYSDVERTKCVRRYHFERSQIAPQIWRDYLAGGRGAQQEDILDMQAVLECCIESEKDFWEKFDSYAKNLDPLVDIAEQLQGTKSKRPEAFAVGQLWITKESIDFAQYPDLYSGDDPVLAADHSRLMLIVRIDETSSGYAVLKVVPVRLRYHELASPWDLLMAPTHVQDGITFEKTLMLQIWNEKNTLDIMLDRYVGTLDRTGVDAVHHMRRYYVGLEQLDLLQFGEGLAVGEAIESPFDPRCEFHHIDFHEAEYLSIPWNFLVGRMGQEVYVDPGPVLSVT